MTTRRRIQILMQIMMTFMAVIVAVGFTNILSRSYDFKAAHASGAGLGLDAIQDIHLYNLRRDGAINALRADPSNFGLLKGQDIIHIFHEPGLVRHDGDVTALQYRTKSCVLDLYFKGGKEKFSKASVEHFEVRPRDHNAPPVSDDPSECVEDLLRQIHRPRMVDVSAIFKSF